MGIKSPSNCVKLFPLWIEPVQFYGIPAAVFATLRRLFLRLYRPSPGSDIPGGNRFSTTDLGVFLQASYRPFDRLRVVAGGRVDDNSVRQTQGYGTVFNPRLAVVYTPKDFTFKAIYSESFLDASNFVKYATDPGVRDLPNPGLQPETAKNLELSASWQISEDFWLDVVAYDSKFSGAVQQVSGVP